MVKPIADYASNVPVNGPFSTDHMPAAYSSYAMPCAQNSGESGAVSYHTPQTKTPPSKPMLTAIAERAEPASRYARAGKWL